MRANLCLRGLGSCLQLALRPQRQLILPKQYVPVKYAHNLTGADVNIEEKTLEKFNTMSKDLFLRLQSENRVLLSDSLTEELEAEILEDAPAKAYALRQAIVEIRGVEKRRKHLFYPPESLSIEEWRTLISFGDYRSRLIYLQSLIAGNTDLDHIRELDLVYTNPLAISEEMINETVGDDQEARRRIKIFQMHHEVQRQEGEMVPYELHPKDVLEITKIANANANNKFIVYLLKSELLKFHQSLRKKDNELWGDVARKIAIEERESEKHIVYGLGCNTIFFRFNRWAFINFNNWTAVREFNEWGLPLVIDMSHQNNYNLPRNRRSSLNTELLNSMSQNRNAKTPFQLYITGLDGDQFASSSSTLTTTNQPEAPVHITPKSHLDMFPHDRLVYLSPDSNVDLVEFNPNDIYVIGGIIDIAGKQPLMLSAAKRLKIRHARFPMKKTIGFTRELNIDTCVNILNDLKEYQDWFYAFRWVPSRHFGNRLKNTSPNQVENTLIYRAHRHLSPLVWKGEDAVVRNQALTPEMYRHYYKKVMESQTKEEMEEILLELSLKYNSN